MRLASRGGRSGVGAYHRAVAEVRECAQCGTPFTPLREHARFCSPRCRMAWNREHAGVAAAPAVAIDWSVIAMTEAAGRLAVAGAWDLHRVAAAVGETVWWVTLVDATLVRYHPRDYESALASKAVRRRKTEGTLEGLRYVRNQLGKSVDPAEFVCPAAGDSRPATAVRRLGLAPAARARARRARGAISAVGAEQVPGLPGAAGRARHRPDLRPLRRVPRPGCGPGRPQRPAPRHPGCRRRRVDGYRSC